MRASRLQKISAAVYICSFGVSHDEFALTMRDRIMRVSLNLAYHSFTASSVAL